MGIMKKIKELFKKKNVEVVLSEPEEEEEIPLLQRWPREKVLLARDEKTSPEILEELANDEDIYVIREIVLNKSSQSWTLDKLADRYMEDALIVYFILQHPNTDNETLYKINNYQRKKMENNKKVELENKVGNLMETSDNLQNLQEDNKGEER